MGWLKNKLYLPEVANLSLDDPALTAKHREVIKKKAFLRRIYIEWYNLLASTLPSGPGDVLEIGSGGGFMREFLPDLVTSDVIPCTGVDMLMDACRHWPFEKKQLKAVLMVDVLHHLPEVNGFFREAEKAVKNSGIIAMIEPWVTPWSRLIYSHLHHEPFVPSTQDWTFPSKGPLSGANSALPWIIFYRDRKLLERKFPSFDVTSITPLMPFSYLFSGGVSMRGLFPQNSYKKVRQVEKWTGLDRRAGMFALIILRRK